MIKLNRKSWKKRNKKIVRKNLNCDFKDVSGTQIYCNFMFDLKTKKNNLRLRNFCVQYCIHVKISYEKYPNLSKEKNLFSTVFSKHEVADRVKRQDKKNPTPPIPIDTTFSRPRLRDSDTLQSMRWIINAA
jgi:ppGpp synthetase/RelA/SpoT-type nucleotidyltranferase